MLPAASLSHWAASGSAAFAEALRWGDLQQCARWLQQDRAVLGARGWHGFTPLHHAAYRGHRALSYLLLEHGADSNIPNDAGETPFHFACRRGELCIMHQMVKNGANVTALDHQGKTALHQAVSGGSIVAIRYLEEMGRFNFRDTDRFLQTPLHIAASLGNEDVTKYLLRDSRCRVEATDTWGMTPMHVAAQTGSVAICWLLLMEAGFAALQPQNKDGLAPLDLAKQGKTHRHQEVTKLLNKYSKEQQRGKPKQPTGLYYGCLLLPGVLSSIVFLIASYLGKYGGAFSVVAFAILARMVFFQYHRISHLARLPNPMYVGTFAAGIFHSLYCFYYKILPVLWPDKLLLWCMTMLATTLLWMFKELLTRDPGNLQKSGCEAEYSTVTQLIEANQNPSRFCIYCEVIQPEQTKHCRLCNTCMVNFDHHCLFLMKCVARDNQRLFVLFLLEVFVCHLTFTASALYCLNLRYGLNLEVAQSVLSLESWVVGLALMNLATAVWELMVLKDQLVTISTNSTTTFTHRPNATAYSWGRRLKNVTTFLLTGIRLQSSQRNFSSQF
ncbi:palmitoyltransferase AKR1 isoform X1 [Carcharodon carcharias]|uniref:palmitoyltransferase AKR1 isoform X1 n=1 Tax=Carcharodon carcharias TaxID=13397 RepID=UPI001B7F7789|nr:palmitoyltransferase AKR1 isoform X1 [Carcharodon carcharias]